MGPIVLFDKSFLQSLSLNEAVLFDQFFLSNICPMFFVETLADLNKAVRAGRTPEEEVGIIADKTPEVHCYPNQFHLGLSIGDFMGCQVPMTGQIPIRGGRPIRNGSLSGISFEEPAESRALRRWQDRRFMEVERDFARLWRGMLTLLDVESVARGLREFGLRTGRCKSLEDAKKIADAIVMSRDKPNERIKLAFWFLGIPRDVQEDIIVRWTLEGYPPLIEFAPYASFLLSVQIFFHVALTVHLVSKKPSSMVDIAYLFYLPFCMIFISSDRLHERCTPLFLRPDQEFISGKDLKGDLNRIEKYFDELPDVEKEKGLNTFAATPPAERDFLVTRIWDRHLPKWRTAMKPHEPNPEKDRGLVEHMTKLAKAQELKPEEVDFDLQEPDFVIVKRKTTKRRGKWWQLPKDLPNKE
jgi:hypothetical protein